MATQKFMGRNQLVARLGAQVGSPEKATAILKARGDMDASGALTSKGKKRDSMTAAERAKDRAARASGKSPAKFSYNPKTNTAKLKGF
ncbi:hypothetical protein UFOVP1288_71 [uncultured Caudovirales phage]|uniref:Uncharacterized protein n=1 Tax=uncultured Caudovirales phage TaxID=2100421 RepID=A0A6J5RWB5_9CAUD|nr:hypothetical protein UFOVP1195_71 [uncultured Caudovirales phage]CAB4196254.1 hypothetical protein UFOVP1288_71 [uncultured Caudovirales phage]CAB4205196.1 hypothetical protein UFOVP1409_71 [uncultured Caudovirales phage]